MQVERFKKVDEILDAALDLPKEKRADFLAEKCDDDELQREVLSLLEAEENAQGFLQHSAMNLMAKKLANEQTTIVNGAFIGKEFSTYKIEKLLGAGGMGEVYLAHDSKLKRKVALKILPAEFLADPERIKRFKREARAVSAMNHPNIVTIYDFGISDSVNFIATEFVEGKTLRQLINQGVELKQTLLIISQICEALSAAHREGIIHRDIKPENIMVRPDGYVKVLDFGLAKLTAYDDLQPPSLSNVTRKGLIIGTLAYMSPEQISDENVDHRTDLWSLGVILFEMLTGKNPFKMENRQATLNAILAGEPPLVSELKPNLPREFDAILSKALEKDADLSYQTASDIRADLKRVRREIESGATSSSTKRTVKNKKNTYLSVIWKPVLAVFVLGLLAFSIYLARNFFSETPPNWLNANATRLTDFTGEEIYPTISPDGKTLVYVGNENGNYDIFRLRVGGSNRQNLTRDSDANDTQPSLSPDGEKIAFRSDRQGGGIFVMGATGESVKRLTDEGFNPAWSPSGNEIVYSTVEFNEPFSVTNSGEIRIVNAATGEKREIMTSGNALQPSFSPNGKRLAFWSRDEKFQRDLWTVAVSGGEAVRVTNDESLDWNPIWSPDGEFIYFCSNRNGGASLWRIRVNQESGKTNGEPEAVTAPLAQSWFLTISGDGKNLVYVRRQYIENVQQIKFDPNKKQIIGKPLIISGGTKLARTPDISPDGKYVAFYLTGETHEDIVLVKTDNLSVSEVTNDVARDRVPRFSPVDSRIAFYSNVTGNYEIWTMNIDGSERRQITEFGKPGVCYPIWSPDGKQLVFTVLGGESRLMNIEEKPSRISLPLPPLDEKEERFIAWSWSPDGKKLAGWRADKSVGEYEETLIYNIDTKRYEKLSETAGRAVWMADNRNLLAIEHGKLILLDSQTKTKRELASFLPQKITSPAVTRDNRRIVFSLQTLESDIQMLSLK